MDYLHGKWIWPGTVPVFYVDENARDAAIPTPFDGCTVGLLSSHSLQIYNASTERWEEVGGSGGKATTSLPDTKGFPKKNTSTATSTKDIVVLVTDNIIINTKDTGKIFNVRSSNAVTLLLPQTALKDVGIKFTFVKTSTGPVIIQLNGDDRIVSSVAGGQVYNEMFDETYATLSITLVDEAFWIITGAHGNWIVN